VIGAFLFTFAIRESQLPPTESETPIRPLEESKSRIYESLRDLQFEYRVGKLSDEDYQAAKAELQKELARVLAQIDEFTSGAPKAAPPAASAKTADPYHCHSCGATFKEPLKFCGECGKPMESAS
jgi:UDP-N-acetylenolpyruvoylglucosamine reductase